MAHRRREAMKTTNKTLVLISVREEIREIDDEIARLRADREGLVVLERRLAREVGDVPVQRDEAALFDADAPGKSLDDVIDEVLTAASEPLLTTALVQMVMNRASEVSGSTVTPENIRRRLGKQQKKRGWRIVNRGKYARWEKVRQ